MAAATETKLLNEHTELISAAGATFGTAEPIHAGDVLLVIDMQNDFVPKGSFGIEGCGAFGVAEGDSAAPKIVQLINAAAKAGARIIASRDYHPDDHCSFNDESKGLTGPFPPHCVQGSLGSFFVPPVKVALTEAKQGGAETHIVFKGYSNDIDSFGAFQYGADYATERHIAPTAVQDGGEKERAHNKCSQCWTGGAAFKCSNITRDLDAPPDVKAVLDREAVTVEALIPSKSTRLFICGLAFDFCVLDTAINASVAGYSEVYIVYDAARSAHIPGVGKFGTGFLSDPQVLADKFKKYNVRVVLTENVLNA